MQLRNSIYATDIFSFGLKRYCLCLLCISVAHPLVVSFLSFSQLPSSVVGLGTGRILHFNIFTQPRAGHLESNPRIKCGRHFRIKCSSRFQALLDAAFRKLYNPTCYSRGHASNTLLVLAHSSNSSHGRDSCHRHWHADYHASSAHLKFWSVKLPIRDDQMTHRLLLLLVFLIIPSPEGEVSICFL